MASAFFQLLCGENCAVSLKVRMVDSKGIKQPGNCIIRDINSCSMMESGFPALASVCWQMQALLPWDMLLRDLSTCAASVSLGLLAPA